MRSSDISIKILNFVFRLVRFVRMREFAIRHPPRRNTFQSMRRVFGHTLIDKIEIGTHFMATFSAPNVQSNLHFIYLHGGAYVWQGGFFNWSFIKQIMLDLACKATCVAYPLAPENTYIDTFTMLEAGFSYLTKRYPKDRFVFIGDSAGGGLALAFAQNLAENQAPVQPETLILLSPWLDLNLDNIKIAEVAEFDHLLSVEGLRIAADLYAGGSKKIDYRLSPLYGKLKGLGKIILFTGTHEILWPDCRRLHKNASAAGVDIAMYEYRGMPHTWMLFPLQEAYAVRNKIVNELME